MLMYFHRASWHSSATVTEVFSCFFLSCKANARVKPAKMGHGPHFSIFVFFYVLFVLCRSVYCLCCKCALYYCHRVATQLQLTDISYHIIYHIISYHIKSAPLLCRISFFRGMQKSVYNTGTAFLSPHGKKRITLSDL